MRQTRYADGGRLELLEHAIDLVTVDGFYAEFGVYRGASLAFIANRIDAVIYGFDSFEGLPSDWFLDYGQGFFSLAGQSPRIDTAQQNFRLLKGWFADSLPGFTAQIDGPAAFLHIDCDIYDSTCTVLEGLAPRLVPGTVIVLAEWDLETQGGCVADAAIPGKYFTGLAMYERVKLMSARKRGPRKGSRLQISTICTKDVENHRQTFVDIGNGVPLP